MGAGAVRRRIRFAVIAVAGALALMTTAGAQPPPAGEPALPAAPPATGAPSPGQLTLPNGQPAVVIPLDPSLAPQFDPTAPRPGSVMRRPEQLRYRPSGFWTSNRPARGGAYRWRILAAGVLVLGITVFFVLRLLRRSSRERAAALADALP